MAAAQRIDTVAGTGEPGFSGDGGPAASARLYLAPGGISPAGGLALDASGHLFIADTANHRIRKVAAGTGIITTVAGTGRSGFAGDGGLAASADLSFPTAVVVDAGGNLFIADQFNNRIRKVAARAGTITTVAGGGLTFPGTGGPATSAQLDLPTGLAIDASGNVFIADQYNNQINALAAGTARITTVAGTGAGGFRGDGGDPRVARLSQPAAVAVDASGNLYVADANRIRRIAAPLATCPDGPPAAGATLTISQARARAGDLVTFSVSGTSGEVAAVGYSRSNSGLVFRGQSLSLGTDLGVVFVCRLSGAGSCAQSVAIPASIAGRFFFQAGRSSDPAFQAGTFTLTSGTCIEVGPAAAGPGTLTGTVTDNTGRPLAGATSSAGTAQATTDASGNYSLSVSAGPDVRVEVVPPSPYGRTAQFADVTAGATARLDFRVNPPIVLGGR